MKKLLYIFLALGVQGALSSMSDNPPADSPETPVLIQVIYDEESSVEIQLADDGMDPKVIMAHQPYPYPVPPYPVLYYGNVCRSGGFYCYTNPAPIGTPCTCWTVFGFLWFTGYIAQG